MSDNLNEFLAGVNRFEKMAEQRRRDRTKAVALRGLRGVVFATRVDTGRARGNWQVEEGRRPEGFEKDKKDPGGGTTLAEGSREIFSASGDDIIWTHNGVPYIGFLEELDKMLAGTFESLKAWIRST